MVETFLFSLLVQYRYPQALPCQSQDQNQARLNEQRNERTGLFHPINKKSLHVTGNQSMYKLQATYFYGAAAAAGGEESR